MSQNQQQQQTKQLPALPMDIPAPIAELGYNQAGYQVLKEVVFPGADSVEALVTAAGYCKLRGIDPFKRAVHCITFFNTDLGKKVTQIIPGIGEARLTAHRTGVYMGMEPVAYGPEKQENYGGMKLSYPEWAEVTVYRLIAGQKCPFTARAYFTEFMQTNLYKKPSGKWGSMPRHMLAKCAENLALKMAFPEEVGDDPVGNEAMVDDEFIDFSAPSPPPGPTEQAKQQAAQEAPPAAEEAEEIIEAEAVEEAPPKQEEKKQAAPPSGRKISQDQRQDMGLLALELDKELPHLLDDLKKCYQAKKVDDITEEQAAEYIEKLRKQAEEVSN